MGSTAALYRLQRADFNFTPGVPHQKTHLSSQNLPGSPLGNRISATRAANWLLINGAICKSTRAVFDRRGIPIKVTGVPGS
ncbi:hypothetical protein PFLUV_G00245280 [Perca fluviatilis]|uniref:Uncharacterized protein n=1 Tax=Perca fluviatilis TaxID=8168 RepID=A0A6A5EDB5_PERFL|nr:hypothetical protein PFLUV_G00245280 [Perca fluviatilis]